MAQADAMAEEDVDRTSHEQAARMKRTWVNLLGGTVGGMLQAVTGHPLDTIKVRLQTGHFHGPIECARKTLHHEGVRGFYKGLSTPLVMAGAMNALMFSVNGGMRELVASLRGHHSIEHLSMPEVLIAAWMTAPIYSLLIAPVDLVKNRLQNQSSKVEKLYTGPIDVLSKTIKSNGVLGIFKGYQATTMTRLVGLPGYFVGYDLVKRALEPKEASVGTSGGAALLAGAFGGIAFWGINYPIDFVKTRFQTHHAPNTTIRDTVHEVYHSSGIRGFYRGFVPCIIRAGPANAVAFLGLEWTRNQLLQDHERA